MHRCSPMVNTLLKYPMVRKADAGQALKTFVMESGVPEELTVDGSK